MKKSVISLALIGLLIFCFGFSFVGIATPKNLLSASADYSDFSSQIAELCDESYDDCVYVNKNFDMPALSQALTINDESKNILEQDEKISSQEFKRICEDNDYLVYEEADGYMVRNKYSLKRLIASGEVKNTYNANKVISGYRDFSVLCYDTIEETKYAYEKLLEQGLEVIPDTITFAESSEESIAAEYDYSKYNSWGAKAMDLEVYNDYLTTNNVDKEIVVAVLDSGINTSHNIFKDRILTDSNGEYVGASYYDTKFTYSGYDFEDDKGHGTHVAGTICELTPSNVKILPIKVLNNEGKGAFSFILAALSTLEDETFKNHQIVAVNISIGVKLKDESSKTWYLENFEPIFKSLKEKKILPVVSAGNDHMDTESYAFSLCEEPIVVSALMQLSGSYSYELFFTNYGDEVDICAPGSDIKSAYIVGNGVYTSKTEVLSGTSMAAPHVAAAIALFACDNYYYIDDKPTYTAEDLEKRLYLASVDLGDAGKDIRYGHGMLNLKNHLPFVNFAVENKEITYDGEYHNIDVTVLDIETYTISYGLAEGDYSITNTLRVLDFKNATDGPMAVYFKITASRHFDTYGVGYLTINPIELSATVEDQTCTYGEINLDQNKCKFSTEQILQGESTKAIITTDATNTTPVGEYNIDLESSNTNYKFKYTSAKLKVEKRDISIKLNDQSFVYGNLDLNTNAYIITSGKLVNNDDLGLVLNTNATSLSNVGNYVITLNSYTNANYNLLPVSNSALTITHRPLTIKLNNQSSMYGDKIELDCSEFEITEGEVVGETSLGLTLKTSANTLEIGKSAIEIDTVENDNYDLTVIYGIYEVTKRQFEIIIEDQTYKYGENFTLDKTKYQIPEDAIVNNDELNFNLYSTGNNTSKVGEYVIDLIYSNENYLINIVKGILKIEQRNITVTFSNTNYEYGDEVSLENVKFALSGDSIVNDDIVNIILSSSSNDLSNAGEYQIKATSSNRNYSLNLVNNLIIVKPIKIIATFSQTGIYGDTIKLDKSSCILQGETINGDELNYILSTTATSTSNIGTYEVYANSTDTNYDISFTKGEYIIKPRPISIQIYNQTSVYGNTINLNQTSSYKIGGGVVNNDDLGVTLHTTATKRSNVGDYKITATIENDNYDLTYTSGNLEITKREIMVRLLDQSVPYTFNIKTDDAAYKVISGSLVNDDNLRLSIFADINGFSLVGNYSLYADCNNENYDVKIISGVLRVEFSMTSLLVIAIPLVLVTSAIIAVYFVKRKMKFNRYNHEDDDLI